MTKIRISKKLFKEISESAKRKGRTVSEQLEFCARLGMIVDKSLSSEEIELILTTSSWVIKIEKVPDEQCDDENEMTKMSIEKSIE